MNKKRYVVMLMALLGTLTSFSAFRDEGGEVIKPGSMKGYIQIGNAQKTIAPSVISETERYLWKTLKYKITVDAVGKVTPDIVSSVLKKSGAAAGVYLVEDPTLPVVLVAPEDHWSIINVSRLAEGAPTQKYIEMRVKKELVRAFVYTCGGSNASHGHPMMGALRKIDDLDAIAKIELPFDVLMRFNGYMRKLGVTPAVRMSYEEACQEGWASAPTNDIQKAVWDKVHAIPKNPMTIKYDPKKGR